MERQEDANIKYLNSLLSKTSYTARDKDGNTENIRQAYLDSSLPKLWSRMYVQEPRLSLDEAVEIMTSILMEVTSPNYFVKRQAATVSARQQVVAYCDFIRNQKGDDLK